MPIVPESCRRSRTGRWTFLAPSLAIDLGSENARIAVADRPYSYDSLPSRITVDTSTDKIVAFGEQSRRMTGRVPSNYRVEAPIRAGVIVDPDLAEFLMRQLIRESIGRRNPPLIGPEFVIAAPAIATSVQLHALVVAARAAGAGRVGLVHESIAAALGAGLPVARPQGSLIVEMGAEKTEIAVIALGGIVTSSTVRVGGAQVSDAIARHLLRAHQLRIGRPSADAIKIAIGCATRPQDPRFFLVRGRDLLRGIPSKVELKGDDFVQPIQEVLDVIVSEIRGVLERTPLELLTDVSRTGVVLSGGGSQLTGLAAYFERALHLPVLVAEEPAASVVRGCQRCARDRELLRESSRIDQGGKDLWSDIAF